ncbi:MAG: hypothetical protein KKF16_04005 [Euryarchaeota archaeon]|nr:hypothetical protein [Euryarchaeota archaeon]MBU4608355.1 hypothetical protein [Euryarchaeota archaeon]MBV1729570.1 hypothetical protein [Methanobacterium sp.]MBV1754127.1 hypothetical protein [Methanobacterium sp.]
MKLLQVEDILKKGKNVLLYQEEVEEYYDFLSDKYRCILLKEPIPLKYNLLKCVKFVSNEERGVLNRLNQPELRDKLLEELDDEVLIIFFNHFQALTWKSAHTLLTLWKTGKVLFFCSFNHHFKPEIYKFYQTFTLINKEEYEKDTGKNEINITYPLYLVVAILIFLLYIRTASTAFIAVSIIGGAWFSFLMVRSMMYVGGKV